MLTQIERISNLIPSSLLRTPSENSLFPIVVNRLLLPGQDPRDRKNSWDGCKC